MTVGARDLEPARSARELYGTELRRQRQLARMSLDRLSDVVNYSKTHLHGVETAERLPLPPISEKLDVAFGTGELFQGLWGAVKRERNSTLKGVRYDRCLELEAKASRIQEYSPYAVPGLLQTEPYMRAQYNANRRLSPETVECEVAKRLGRKRVLRREDPPDCWFILDEAVLRRPVGGPAVFREQLAALLTFVDTALTTIQVVPFSAGEHSTLSGTHMLLTLPDNFTTAYVETSGCAATFDDPKTVAQRQRDYDRMKACALPPWESTAFIEEALETFKSCEYSQP